VEGFPIPRNARSLAALEASFRLPSDMIKNVVGSWHPHPKETLWSLGQEQSEATNSRISVSIDHHSLTYSLCMDLLCRAWPQGGGIPWPKKRVDSSARYHILGMSGLSWALLPIGSNSIMGNALT
jgi:hypothetical protein